jgi:hypothetical protein
LRALDEPPRALGVFFQIHFVSPQPRPRPEATSTGPTIMDLPRESGMAFI